jgi:hypothetical protein
MASRASRAVRISKDDGIARAVRARPVPRTEARIAIAVSSAAIAGITRAGVAVATAGAEAAKAAVAGSAVGAVRGEREERE